MYQSLYRKYRPQNFDEVVGQEIVKKTLIHSILNNKISHAYLFTGPRGTGKTSIAKILAKTVNCLNLNGSNSCNECINCLQFNNKQSTDVIEIDAASNNGVDEIRELKNKINIVPSTGKYKVYIIDEVHMLTVGAFNALLKTLEEPPAHVIFILATTEPHKIPATILSRCQRFDFKKIPISQISNHLLKIAELESINIDASALDEIARISDGGMRDAFSLFEQTIAYEENNITLDVIHEINGTVPQVQLYNLYNNLIENNIENIFSIIDNYDTSGKNLVKILDEFILFLRNILLSKEAPLYLKSKIDDISLYDDIKEKISETKLFEYINKLNVGLNELKNSGNPRLSMELLFIDIMTSINNKQATDEKKETKTDLIKSEQIKANKINELNSEKQIENKKITYSENYKKNLEQLIEIRVNNTLCNFDKKNYLELKNKMEDANQYILNPEYSSAANIIINGNLKAANKNYFVFVYDYEELKYNFYEEVETIEKLLNEIYNNNVHAVAVTLEEWNTIKESFNKQLKIYKYIEEPDDIMSFLHKSKNSNKIEDSFESLIQYN